MTLNKTKLTAGAGICACAAWRLGRRLCARQYRTLLWGACGCLLGWLLRQLGKAAAKACWQRL